jgi:hypothetical protein
VSAAEPRAEGEAAEMEMAALVRDAIALALPSLAGAVRGAEGVTLAGDLGALTTELEARRRLVAVGERAFGLRHALNNPLAALVAEIQMLQLDETLGAEHQSAAGRMLELCRRLVQVVRRLDTADAPSDAVGGGVVAAGGAGASEAARSSHTHAARHGGEPSGGSSSPAGAPA